jgi:predicted secreted protein
MDCPEEKGSEPRLAGRHAKLKRRLNRVTLANPRDGRGFVMAAISRLGLILLAFALAGSGNAALARKSYATVLTEQSANWVTKVGVGEPVEIQLKTQGGTGFSWFPTSSASKVKALPPLKSSRMLPGGTEVQRFLFKSKRKGTYIVGFSYGQPWNGGTKGAKSRAFTIKVR